MEKYQRTYEIVPGFWDFEPPRPGKPMNTRTRGVVRKERRRRANLPRTMQRRLARA